MGEAMEWWFLWGSEKTLFLGVIPRHFDWVTVFWYLVNCNLLDYDWPHLDVPVNCANERNSGGWDGILGALYVKLEVKLQCRQFGHGSFCSTCIWEATRMLFWLGIIMLSTSPSLFWGLYLLTDNGFPGVLRAKSSSDIHFTPGFLIPAA